VTDNPRLDELRRRVQQDPASIAFAPLAEELRRAGEHFEAVSVCLAGLEHHPTFLSARVTLGRALAALEQYREAQVEFEYVLNMAPDNLLARKSLTELEAHIPLAPSQSNPSLEELEQWLARIEADRAERAQRAGAHSASTAGGLSPREDSAESLTRNPS
jgi:tetratricopeptide (TPR) repeat protein